MSFTRKLLPALLLAAGCGSALAQAEIRVCDRPNLNGRCIDLRHGVGDLRRFDFDQRVTSFEIRSGTWLMCSQAGFGGRCEAFDRSVDHLVPRRRVVVSAGQVYAWNPSITGTKSEDTILVGEKENEVLTSIDGWPTISVTVDGQTFERPAILEIL